MSESIEFEVFGKVQKVFFRKFTKIQAEKLGVTGWCENTDAGTVRGIIESGNLKSLDEMKKWLSSVGSPKSKIERCVFKKATDSKFSSFEIRNFQVQV